jgi:hypothetical protein
MLFIKVLVLSVIPIVAAVTLVWLFSHPPYGEIIKHSPYAAFAFYISATFTCISIYLGATELLSPTKNLTQDHSIY